MFFPHWQISLLKSRFSLVDYRPGFIFNWIVSVLPTVTLSFSVCSRMSHARTYLNFGAYFFINLKFILETGKVNKKLSPSLSPLWPWLFFFFFKFQTQRAINQVFVHSPLFGDSLLMLKLCSTTLIKMSARINLDVHSFLMCNVIYFWISADFLFVF